MGFITGPNPPTLRQGCAERAAPLCQCPRTFSPDKYTLWQYNPTARSLGLLQHTSSFWEPASSFERECISCFAPSCAPSLSAFPFQSLALAFSLFLPGLARATRVLHRFLPAHLVPYSRGQGIYNHCTPSVRSTAPYAIHQRPAIFRRIKRLLPSPPLQTDPDFVVRTLSYCV